jgi:hypothetical protein
LSYKSIPEFFADKGVQLAIDFINDGTIPKHFDWIKRKKRKERVVEPTKNARSSSVDEKETESDSSSQSVPALIKESLPIPKKQRWIKMYKESLP